MQQVLGPMMPWVWLGTTCNSQSAARGRYGEALGGRQLLL